jgi:hypothetical protein
MVEQLTATLPAVTLLVAPLEMLRSVRPSVIVTAMATLLFRDG